MNNRIYQYDSQYHPPLGSPAPRPTQVTYSPSLLPRSRPARVTYSPSLLPPLVSPTDGPGSGVYNISCCNTLAGQTKQNNYMCINLRNLVILRKHVMEYISPYHLNPSVCLTGKNGSNEDFLATYVVVRYLTI